MITIIAQSTPLFTPEEEKRWNIKQLPDEEIPLADEESIPEGEISQPELAPKEEPELTSTPEPIPEPKPVFPKPVPEIPAGEIQPELEEEPEEEPTEEEPEIEDEFEEVPEQLNELDDKNKTLNIAQKVDASMSEGYPLRIIYTTLRGHTTERTVRPDYYLPARTTGNWVLIAWCELRNDWRGFIVERIRAAKLEPKEA
jgi:hypothetical protein